VSMPATEKAVPWKVIGLPVTPMNCVFCQQVTRSPDWCRWKGVRNDQDRKRGDSSLQRWTYGVNAFMYCCSVGVVYTRGSEDFR
jgi:hypothetical protein